MVSLSNDGDPKTVSVAARLDELLGFPARVLPAVAVLGLGFMLATVPDLFVRMDESDYGADRVQSVFSSLRDVAARFSEWQGSDIGTDLAQRSVQAIPLALLVMFAAAAIRAGRSRAWIPLLLVMAGLMAGFLGLLLVAWVAQLVVWTVRLAGIVIDLAQALFEWAAPVAGVVGAVVVLAAIGFTMYFVLRWAFEERVVAVQALAATLAVALVGYVFRTSIAALATWIGGIWGDHVAPAIGFVVGLIIIVGASVVVAAFVVLWCGGVGQAVFVPAFRSRSAGHDPNECISMAIGVGLLLSLLMLAAASNAPFAFFVSEVWTSSPDVILPIDIYYQALPDEVHNWVDPAFDTYSPLVDCVMLLIVSLVGSLSLVFSSKSWADTAARRVLLPSLLVLAVGLVVIVPIIVIGALVSDDA